jgi:divalent metal cation (Fe/Co/Zn/Cd) transporter
VAFAVLAAYLVIQLVMVLANGVRPATSGLGIAWTALTFLVMLALAWGKIRTGQALGNPVLRAEGRVTLIDAFLSGAVLAGLALNALFGWWWADPLAGLVIVYYADREARQAFKHTPGEEAAA